MSWANGRRRVLGKRKRSGISRWDSLPPLNTMPVVQASHFVQRVLRKRATAGTRALMAGCLQKKASQPCSDAEPGSGLSCFARRGKVFLPTRFSVFALFERGEFDRHPLILPTGEAGRQKQGGAGEIISPACLFCLFCLSSLPAFSAFLPYGLTARVARKQGQNLSRRRSPPKESS